MRDAFKRVLRWSATLGVLGTGVAVAPAVAHASGVTALPSSSAHPQYGVLIADPTYAASDHSAGVRLAAVSLNWSQWEPSAGRFSSSYQAQEAEIVHEYLHDGFTVAVNPGMNTAPSWVFDEQGGRLIDQHGASAPTPNFEFSAAVRGASAAYLANVVKTLGPVAYYMIGMSASSEADYPKTTTNQWWGFDSNAQGSTHGLPAGESASPMPGWIPGTATWKGVRVSTAQVQGWYNWYIGGDISALAWEMGTLRSAGFNGHFEVKMPGDGANPWVYAHRVASDLAPESYDHYDTLNSGAVYQVVYARLPNLTGVVVDVTSVGDHSGTPADKGCTASDASVNYETNSAVDNWSSTRWLSYLARIHGLPVAGESTGWDSAADMTHDFGLVKSCGLIAFQWAFDYELYQAPYATIGDYAKLIGTTPTAGAAASPGSHSFGARSISTTSAPLSIQLSNTGSGALHVTAVSLHGTGFVGGPNSCAGATLAPAGTCTVTVAFRPVSVGAASASVVFSDNAPGRRQTVSLSGSGMAR